MSRYNIPLDGGRQVYVPLQIIGISPELGVYGGYEGHLFGEGTFIPCSISSRDSGELLFEGGELVQLNLDDKLYICEIALTRWTELREKLLKEKEDENA